MRTFLRYTCLTLSFCFIVHTNLAASTEKKDERMLIQESVPFLEPDAKLGWRNKPQFDDFFPNKHQKHVARYTINALGERISADKNAASESSVTVWVVGDSSPFGFGINNEDTFTEKLSEHYDSKLEIRNMSVVGYRSPQVIKLLKAQLKENNQNPDIIILWCGFNDLIELRYNKLIEKRLTYYSLKSNVVDIIKMCRRRKISLILNTLPSYEDIDLLNKYNTWLLAKHAPQSGIYTNDVQERFYILKSKNLFASIDDHISQKLNFDMHIHPSVRGHKVIAKMLTQLIDEITAEEEKE